jgi:hypothetical protein
MPPALLAGHTKTGLGPTRQERADSSGRGLARQPVSGASPGRVRQHFSSFVHA